MRALLDKHVLPVFFAIVFLGSALLGPLLFFASRWIRPAPPFHRTMDRALMICAVIALVLFWKKIPFRQLWPTGPRAGRQVAFGYLLALVSSQAMIGLDLALRGFTSNHLNGHQILLRALMALTAAILIPPLEETIFRGFLLTQLLQSMGRAWACVVAALIFMLAHFLKIPASLDAEPVSLLSGFHAVGSAFLPVVQGECFGGRGLNIFLIGLILGGIFLRAGSLWINAGLHSGWILALLLFSGLARPIPHPPIHWLRTSDLLSTPVTSLVLLLLTLWLWRYYPPRSGTPEPGESAP